MRSAAAVVAVAVTVAIGLASTAPSAMAVPPGRGWADVDAALGSLAVQADAAGAAASTGRAGEPVLPTTAPVRVAQLLGGLDGTSDPGTAAAVWHGLFGSGSAALVPAADGSPTAAAAFADPAGAARFVRRRIARARDVVRGRKGSSAGTAALEGRVRRAVADIESPPRKDLPPGAPSRCGPVQVVAAGDTAALGDICADLDRYWSRTGAEVVRVQARHPGPVPAAARQMTAATSAVDAVVADVEAAASGPPDGTGDAGAARQHTDPAPTPAPSTPPDAGRRDRIAPVLAAARRARTWMPAAGGAVAMALGLTVVRRVREEWPAGVSR